MIKVLLLTCCLACICSGQCQISDSLYHPIPEGYGFPASPQDLAVWLGFNPARPLDTPFGPMQISRLRRHVWDVFAGMTQPSHEVSQGVDLPVWETWYEKNETPCGPPSRKYEAKFAVPLTVIPEAVVTNPTAKMLSPARPLRIVSRVLYNRSTLQFILDNDLRSESTLKCLKASHQTIDFPPQSVAVKTTWRRVDQEGCTEIPVWDAQVKIPYSTLNGTDDWPRRVGVIATEGDISACPKAHDFVSYRNFYWHRVADDAEAKQIQDLSVTMQDPDLKKTKTGDLMVLVGLHFTTKEIPNWVWGTFWWHDRANGGPFAADRPPSVKGVWAHYLMDCAYDMDRPQEPDSSPKIAFNPYLESHLNNGNQSNCMTCHRRAVWKVNPKTMDTWNSVGLPNNGTTTFPQIVVRGSEAAQATYFPKFEESLKLDFLWTLASPKAAGK